MADRDAAPGPARHDEPWADFRRRPARRRGPAGHRRRRRLRPVRHLRVGGRGASTRLAVAAGADPEATEPAVPAGHAVDELREERVPRVVSRPDGVDPHVPRQREGPCRARARAPRSDEDRGPAPRVDRHGPVPGGLPSAVPDAVGRPARGRAGRRGLRLLLPARAEHRPLPDAGVPAARVRLPGHPRRGPRPPGPSGSSAASTCSAASGWRSSRWWPTTRSSGAPAGCWRPTSAPRSSSTRSWRRCSPRRRRRPSRRRTATSTTSPGPSTSTTADGELAHTACFGFGVDRITLALLDRHGTDPAAGPPTSGPCCGPRPARRSGAGMTVGLLRLDGGRLRPPSPARVRAELDGDQLLRRRVDRGAARPRPRPGGRGRVHAQLRLRGRPVDVLQVPARGPVRRCTASTSPR